MITLNRMAFGPRPGDLEAFLALGGDDQSRLETYVDQQLDPTSINDDELDARLERYTTLTKSQTQLWAEHRRGPSSARNQPLHETETAVFIRAVYSKRQLLEVLADFWNNHFNVFPQSGAISSMFSHYDNSVIRPHLLGNFREMLEAVATSPAMLFYLDNYVNVNAGPNENYARELFELHTLGADHYLGVGRQSEVPRDGTGKPVGYVDDDVYEATRSLTGWTVNEDTGEFWYRTDWHDRFQKNVLGQFLPPDQPPLADGKMVLDLLASHPGTGRHIAYKLCRRLVADRPSARLVEEAAQLFTATWQAPDQLAQVVRWILLSQEFRLTWGRKVKRPFEVLTSFLRGLGTTFTYYSASDPEYSEHRFSRTFRYLLNHTGQKPFGWRPPNGYPDTREEWLSATPLIGTWRMLNWIVNTESDDNYLHDVVAETPVTVRSPNALADFWIDRLLGREIVESDRNRIIGFMAQGRNPDLPLHLDTDDRVRERLRAMIGLIAMCPDNYLR